MNRKGTTILKPWKSLIKRILYKSYIHLNKYIFVWDLSVILEPKEKAFQLEHAVVGTSSELL